MDKRKRNAIIIVVCFIAFSLGLILLSYNYILGKRDLAFEKINMQINDNKEVEIKDKKDVPEKKEENNQTNDQTNAKQKNTYHYDYIGTLEIPKINLTKGFVDMNSKHNNVDYNMQIIKPSNYPDVENGNLIIASHSGSSSISYFKHLYKLNVGDMAYIYYNNVKYTYQIVNIYKEPKTGYLNIYRDLNQTTLTLVTCTKNDDTTQTVYICNLINKENVG